MTRLPLIRSKAFTIPRGRWFVEVIGAAAGYELYDAIQARTSGDADEAIRAGRDIYRLEGDLHLDPEHAFNAFATHHNVVGIISGYWYGLMHVFATACVLIYLGLRRRGSYARLRTALVVLSLIGLLVFWLYPVAPPRFAVGGLTDTLAAHNTFGARHVHKGLVNLYAAMPSLHLAWSSWCAGSVWLTNPHSRWRNLAWAYPVLMACDVLMTANHYFLDIVAGVALTTLVLPWWRPRTKDLAPVGAVRDEPATESAYAP